jgi:MFS family permease
MQKNMKAAGGLALSMLLSSLGTSVANVALPTLTGAFGASFGAVQWVVLAYLLALTVAIVGVGRLGDLAGHRRVLLAGIALFTAAAALCGLAPSLGTLVAARAAQGAGAAVLMALAMALVRDTVPEASTGSAMGLLGTTSAAGTALGPSLGGVLIAGPGWRAIFLVMVALGLLNFWLVYRQVPAARPARSGSRAFDRAGTLLLAVTLAAYALATTVGGPALLVLAALGAVLFLVAETRAAEPLIRPAALRDPLLGGGLAMNALVATVMMTTLVVGPFHLAGTLGLGAAAVGAVMSIGPVLSALTGVPAGRLVDRQGAPFALGVGLAAMAAGCLALWALPPAWGVAGYVAAIAVLTPGYQLFLAANNTAVMLGVEADRRGVVAGMLGLSRNLGLVTGASAMGAVYAATGLRTTFAVAAALVAAALAAALAGPRAARSRPMPAAQDGRRP